MSNQEKMKVVHSLSERAEKWLRQFDAGFAKSLSQDIRYYLEYSATDIHYPTAYAYHQSMKKILSPIFGKMFAPINSNHPVQVPVDDGEYPGCYRYEYYVLPLFKNSCARVTQVPSDGMVNPAYYRSPLCDTLLIHVTRSVESNRCVSISITHFAELTPTEIKQEVIMSKNPNAQVVELNWTPLTESSNVHDLEETKTPSHDYIIAIDGEKFTVRYYNRLTGESDSCPDFGTVDEAKNWVRNVHAASKILGWVDVKPGALSECARWFKVANPNPVLSNVTVQWGVHLEEMGEMFDSSPEYKELGDALKSLAAKFKASGDEELAHLATILTNPEKLDVFVDALVDQIVTAVGTLTNIGLNADKLLEEVNRANFSKYVDDKALRDSEHGKIIKGPNYKPPHLAPLIKIEAPSLLDDLKKFCDNNNLPW